jgi:5'-3' exonuclease
MGIRHLNKYLRTNCIDSIRCINLDELNHKKIAIDISIYLYKYEAENMLLENMYLMLSIFRYYNIIPIFIFDGKPPQEKNVLLKKRKQDKQNAKEEYNKLKQILDSNTHQNEYDKQEIISSMDILKKQFIYISKEKIDKVKHLIRAYGATYYDAPGEADALCAMLVMKRKVWACMSEDMDMFVYGCKRVLRYFSLINHNAVLYHMKGILIELNMNYDEFKKICILSGTDYNFQVNKNNSNINLYQTLKLFDRYKNIESKSEYKSEYKSESEIINNLKSDCNNEIITNNLCFYKWLLENTNYITDIELLNKINYMFDISQCHSHLEHFKHIKIINGPIRNELIRDIMKDEGFIFID